MHMRSFKNREVCKAYPKGQGFQQELFKKLKFSIHFEQLELCPVQIEQFSLQSEQ